MSSRTVFPTGNTPQAHLIPFEDFGPQELGPQLSIIRSIHRGPDGYISFAAKRDGEWHELGALHIPSIENDHQPMIPELLDNLKLDGFFSLNTTFRRSRGRVVGTRMDWQPVPVAHSEYGDAASDFPGALHGVEKPIYSRTHPQTQLPYAQHTLDALRWLNVAHVDIDCYRLGLTVGDALGAIIDMQDAGQLPPATMFARSGRGLWAFWYLLDVGNPATGSIQLFNATHTPHTPQRAHARAVAMYARIQKALADKLAHLGADIGALDGARFAPVPGTVKSSTDTSVEYWVQGAHGHGFAYTLPELAQGLQLELREREHPVVEQALATDATKHAGLSAAGKRGWIALHRYYLKDFEILLRLRGGGFLPGHRHRGLYLYAVVLRRNGMGKLDAEARILDAARRSRPDRTGGTVTVAEARAIVRDAFKGRTIPLNAGSLFAELQVTSTEASYLTHIRPTPAPAPVTRRTTQERRDAIQAIVQRLGRVPPTREMAGYTTAQGFPGNWTTIATDYQKLGLTPVKKAGRPKKAHRSLF